jgi:hypothetical protein
MLTEVVASASVVTMVIHGPGSDTSLGIRFAAEQR